ncbi:hypothetical protein ACWDTT_15765 [Streptosporangium sandarakinum]
MSNELTAGDIAPGTGFEVVVKEVDGVQIFEATVHYDWSRRNGPYYDGRGTGRTWTEAASAAINDAEGVGKEDED